MPANGRYTVRVYPMRSAARRNEVAHYTLSVRVVGASKAADSGLGTVSAGDFKAYTVPDAVFGDG